MKTQDNGTGATVEKRVHPYAEEVRMMILRELVAAGFTLVKV